MFILLDNSLSADEKSSLLFENPVNEIRADCASDIISAFDSIDDYQKKGFYLAGYISYECGYFLLDLENPFVDQHESPYIHFYVFKSVKKMNQMEVTKYLGSHDGQIDFSPIYNFNLGHSVETYGQKIEQIKSHLSQGNSYQVNYTDQSHFLYQSNSLSLYSNLKNKQKVEYGAFLSFPERKVLSFSPELFIRRCGDELISRPMKGTANKTQGKEENKVILSKLKIDPKVQSENVMIVDLIRNDMSKVSKAGTVRVRDLFAVEEYETLYQMVSEVVSTLKPGVSFRNIIEALFPCGSITGAPKKKSMEIISHLEEQPRGTYTGAIGYMEPSGDFCFNVPIRTLVIDKKNEGRMGVGGGILYESSVEDEFEECLVKTKFLRSMNDSFSLIETFLFDGQSYPNWSRHLERLKSSCQVFGFSCPTEKIEAELLSLSSVHAGSIKKIRLLVDYEGGMSLSAEPLDEQSGDSPLKVLLSSTVIDSTDIFYQHKTTNRSLYDSEYETCRDEGYYDVLFFNERKELVEASRHNIFLKMGGVWITPPLSSGALPGIGRELFLKNKNVVEQVIDMDMLKSTKTLILVNSLRGEVEVTL